MAEDKTSPQWTKRQVVQRLREGGSDQPVSVQVFLSDDVPDGDVSSAVKKIVSDVESSARKGGLPLKVGKVHQLAKSFSIEADPDIIAAIADQPGVKSILPSKVDDIYPKPTKVKRL